MGTHIYFKGDLNISLYRLVFYNQDRRFLHKVLRNFEVV